MAVITEIHAKIDVQITVTPTLVYNPSFPATPFTHPKDLGLALLDSLFCKKSV